MSTPSALMELLKKTKQQVNVSERVKPTTLPPNSSRWRILPGWSKDKPDFFHDFGLHYVKDSLNKVKAVYICVDKTYGKPCNVCAAIETAINHADDPVTKETLTSARASHRILLNALHLSGPNPLEPVILEVPKTVFGQIVTISEEWSGRTISAEADGIDLVIEKTGKGMNTRYSVTPSPKSAIAVTPAVMSKVTDLDAYVAQEDERAANRALTSIAAVAGIFAPAAPALGSSGYSAGGSAGGGASVSRPALTQNLSETVIEADELKEIEKTVLTEIQDDKELDDAAMGVAATAAATAAVETAIESTSDDELDQLMKELGV